MNSCFCRCPITASCLKACFVPTCRTGRKPPTVQVSGSSNFHFFTRFLSSRRRYLFTAFFARIDSYGFTAKNRLVWLPISKRPRIHSLLIAMCRLSKHANPGFHSSLFFNRTSLSRFTPNTFSDFFNRDSTVRSSCKRILCEVFEAFSHPLLRSHATSAWTSTTRNQTSNGLKPIRMNVEAASSKRLRRSGPFRGGSSGVG